MEFLMIQVVYANVFHHLLVDIVIVKSVCVIMQVWDFLTFFPYRKAEF
jgi:hypothetical protein